MKTKGWYSNPNQIILQDRLTQSLAEIRQVAEQIEAEVATQVLESQLEAPYRGDIQRDEEIPPATDDAIPLNVRIYNEQFSLMLTLWLDVPEVTEQVTLPFDESNYMETEPPKTDFVDEILTGI